MAATPFGWKATTTAGLTSFFTGGMPDASGFASVVPYADEANFDAAVSVVRFPPAGPPTAADLVARAKSQLGGILATGKTFNVAASGSTVNVLCDGTNDTRADLALLALFGQQDVNGTKTWVDNEGGSTVLTGAELVTLATLAGTWISDLYATLGQVLAGIASGSVTTIAQVDSALSPS